MWRISAHWDILITSASSRLRRRDDRVSPLRSSPGDRCLPTAQGVPFHMATGVPFHLAITTRGSPSSAMPPMLHARSIPASAGKPPDAAGDAGDRRVHPRERGEAGTKGNGALIATGPSPRARGSQGGWRGPVLRDGSIPASAGKPQFSMLTATSRRVHPRERGEAGLGRLEIRASRGPSPRARGSRVGRTPSFRHRGSIPASAGKPDSDVPGCDFDEVHPRERGEARSAAVPAQRLHGPSPRARGSRPRRR